MIYFLPLFSVLLLSTSEAEKANSDLKDAECLDEKQVFFQLRSEVRDPCGPKGSGPGVAAHPRWRRNRLPTLSSISSHQHCIGCRTVTSNSTTVAVPANVPASQATEVLVNTDPHLAGCCVQGAVVVYIEFSPGTGFVSVALEAPDPDLTIEILGASAVSASSYFYNAPILQGAVAKGVWKIKLFAAPGATGWSATSSTLSLELGPCV